MRVKMSSGVVEVELIKKLPSGNVWVRLPNGDEIHRKKDKIVAEHLTPATIDDYSGVSLDEQA